MKACFLKHLKHCNWCRHLGVISSSWKPRHRSSRALCGAHRGAVKAASVRVLKYHETSRWLKCFITFQSSKNTLLFSAAYTNWISMLTFPHRLGSGQTDYSYVGCLRKQKACKPWPVSSGAHFCLNIDFLHSAWREVVNETLQSVFSDIFPHYCG